MKALVALLLLLATTAGAGELPVNDLTVTFFSYEDQIAVPADATRVGDSFYAGTHLWVRAHINAEGLVEPNFLELGNVEYARRVALGHIEDETPPEFLTAIVDILTFPGAAIAKAGDRINGQVEEPLKEAVTVMVYDLEVQLAETQYEMSHYAECSEDGKYEIVGCNAGDNRIEILGDTTIRSVPALEHELVHVLGLSQMSETVRNRVGSPHRLAGVGH